MIKTVNALLDRLFDSDRLHVGGVAFARTVPPEVRLARHTPLRLWDEAGTIAQMCAGNGAVGPNERTLEAIIEGSLEPFEPRETFYERLRARLLNGVTSTRAIGN